MMLRFCYYVYNRFDFVKKYYVLVKIVSNSCFTPKWNLIKLQTQKISVIKL